MSIIYSFIIVIIVYILSKYVNNFIMILKIFNIFFRISIIFLMCLIWIRYFVDELWLALLYTVLLTITIEFIIHFIAVKKNAKKILRSEDEKIAEQISTTFIFSPNSALDYFYKLAKIKYIAKKLKKYVEITYENNEISDKTIIYPYYSYSSITPQNLIDILNKLDKSKPNKLIICGYKINSETYKLSQKIKDLKIILLNSIDCYSRLIKPYNIYPENLKNINLKEKLKFKDFLKMSVSKRNTRGYFISALILLFSSFIVRLTIYYIIMSSILLILTLLSFFLPQKSQKIEETII